MPGSGDRSEQVITLFSEMLRRERPERRRFIEQTCAGDQDLYRELSEMLDWEERMGGFLTDPLIQYIDFEALEQDIGSEALEQPFQPGELVAERFRILRFVASGGMGVVYEAFDEKLQKRIAIKCARPGFGPLLIPELQGALKVLHPNICRVHDTHTANTGFGKVEFFTMEFIDGESLGERLHRRGRLEPDEALEIGRQLCAGLAAAHEAGILHRDLKSGNVLLARKDDGKVRAVITDFGLATEARLEAELEGGTPRYMAPELRRGEKPTTASDVYALGVILYEMVTGEPPFKPANHWDPEPGAKPLPPSASSKTLDSAWDKAILPCLQGSPAARPHAAHVLDIFDQRPLWKSPALALALLTVIALVAAFQGPLMRFFQPANIRLAILPVQAPPDLQEFGSGVLQDVANRILRSRGNRQTVMVMPAADLLNNKVVTPQDAVTRLHATHAVQITLRHEADQVVVQEDVVELAYHTQLRDFSASYSQETIGNMSGALAGVIMSTLHLGRTAASDAISPAATAAYDRGLSYLQRDDRSFDNAMEAFQQAAQLDPRSPLPLAGLAEAQLKKNRATHDRHWLVAAQDTIRAAEAVNPDSVAVLLASGRIKEDTGQYEKALQDYRRVEELEPRNVEVQLRIAETKGLDNMPDEALERYRKAIYLAPAFYEPYLTMGSYLYFHGMYAAAADQFREATKLAPGLYDPYFYLGAAETDQGRFDEAEQAFRGALRIQETGAALCALGAIEGYKHQFGEAVQLISRSLLLDPKNYICLVNLGDNRRWLNQPSARRTYQKALDLVSAALQQNPRDGYLRAFVAYLAGRLGDQRRAEDEIEQALQLLPDDNKVLRRAVLTYEMLGKRPRALEIAGKMTQGALLELQRHPDLTDFSRDSRFQLLLSKSQGGGIRHAP